MAMQCKVDYKSVQEQQQDTSHEDWMEAATALKGKTGVSWQQMLLFCPAAADGAARLAARLGMSCVRVPTPPGLNVSCLKKGLEMYTIKLESDRGY